MSRQFALQLFCGEECLVKMESFEMIMLIDFYGQLLTENQLACLDMYYNDDMSYAEIADELDISRQGVFDFVKRGRMALEEYEEKLGLVKRFIETKEQIAAVQSDLKKIDGSRLSSEDSELLHNITETLDGISSGL